MASSIFTFLIPSRAAKAAASNPCKAPTTPPIAPPINPNNQILNEDTCHWDTITQANQNTTNEGGPLDYTDTSDYTDNSKMTPATWEWTNETKTYVSKTAQVVKPAVYQYNSSSKTWEA